MRHACPAYLSREPGTRAAEPKRWRSFVVHLHRRSAFLLVVAGFTAGCAALDQLKGVVQPPHFSQSDERPAELRVLGPTAGMPVGGVGVRLWAKVSNPNPFGFTLGTL